VVLRPGAAAPDDELLAHCRRSLAGYKVPKSIEFRDELPRNPAGKVLKRVLREEFWAGRSIKV
jgi:acyl-CoA synthetase (AMP-forming)/AMP-acid ligase II